jgi:hypothetical protein
MQRYRRKAIFSPAFLDIQIMSAGNFEAKCPVGFYRWIVTAALFTILQGTSVPIDLAKQGLLIAH